MSKGLKRWLILSITLTAVAGMGCTGVDAPVDPQVTVVGEALAPSQLDGIEAEAAAAADQELAGCFCYGSWYATVTAACSSWSCGESESCLYDYLSGFVDCGGDDICNQQLVITRSCFSPAPGSWQVNGYIRYKCGTRVCGP